LFYMPSQFISLIGLPLKEKVYRGTRRLFEVYITDLDGNAQDPDSCTVTFEKTGGYSYDSPRGPFICSKVGTTGYWGYYWDVPQSITLGDWIAKFEWCVSSIPGDAEMNFIIKDYKRPFMHEPYLPAGSEVVG